MAIVKVWNDNDHAHTETFKGQVITIMPKGFIEMDYLDAIDFKGRFQSPKMLGPNNPDPKFFKMIRVEEPTEPVVKEDPNIFHATGEVFKSQAQMYEFAKAFAETNKDLVAKNPEIDRSEINQLRSELAALKELVSQSRNKPGPKPKVAI